MKFAICNETFGDWPIERGFELARQYGYSGIEVAPFTLGQNAFDFSAAQRQAFARSAESFGLEIVGLHWLLAKTTGYHLTTDDLMVRDRTRDYFKELVRLCSDLGGNIMVLGSPQQRNFPESMSHDQAISNAANLLEQVVPTLEEYGVQIAIEPLGPQEGNFLNRAYQARQLIETIGSDRIQLHLDVKAMSSEGPAIDSIIRENADITIHFHANDPNLLGPGMGQVDQRPIFAALQQTNYRGWVSVEVFDYTPGVETILRESMTNMLNALPS